LSRVTGEEGSVNFRKEIALHSPKNVKVTERCVTEENERGVGLVLIEKLRFNDCFILHTQAKHYSFLTRIAQSV